MSDKLIGKTLAGRFVLEELLGTGATGAVYRAQQTSVDRVVAVKTLHAFLKGHEDFKDRFEIEAKAIARLNHPNCITLFDFGYDDEFDVFYMALEYSKGQLLAEAMQENIPYEDVLTIAYQVADALDHAHREGILHRDLKPENIMIERSPNSGRVMVKVLDFGLARLYEDRAENDAEAPSGRYKQITQVGQTYGTPAYMSPEQCRATRDLTPATDLYALGTMMFEMLEGKLPFFSKSTAELMLMQMTEAPPRMARLDVPLAVKDLVHAMMAKDPTVRPQSAQEVLAVLTPFVRLDASQEFRIVRGTSGEFNRTAIERAVRAAGGGDGDRGLDEVSEVELSSHELRATQPRSRVPLVVGVIALLAAVVGIVSLLGRDDNVNPAHAESPVVAAAAGEPASTEESDAATDPVEVATNGEDAAEPAATTTAKPSKASKSKPRSPAKRQSEDNRPKTLKLEY